MATSFKLSHYSCNPRQHNLSFGLKYLPPRRSPCFRYWYPNVYFPKAKVLLEMLLKHKSYVTPLFKTLWCLSITKKKIIQNLEITQQDALSI